MGGLPVEVEAASDMTRYRVSIGGVEHADCIAAGVGNGQTCGGGVRVWPQADPSDGILDACALRTEGIADTIKLAATVRLGRHVRLAEVETTRGDHIEIASEPSMEFNLDGELVGLRTPVRFELAGSIKIRA
jgi:diacylglycerol kinase (ATP)